MAQTSHAWLWQDIVLSDVTLLVFAAGSECSLHFAPLAQPGGPAAL